MIICSCLFLSVLNSFLVDGLRLPSYVLPEYTPKCLLRAPQIAHTLPLLVLPDRIQIIGKGADLSTGFLMGQALGFLLDGAIVG
jgi:hypothetical protein